MSSFTSSTCHPLLQESQLKKQLPVEVAFFNPSAQQREAGRVIRTELTYVGAGLLLQTSYISLVLGRWPGVYVR